MGTHPIFESDFDCITDKRLTHLFCSGIKSSGETEKMSYEPKKEEIQQEEDPNHRIRITISSKNCKAIEPSPTRSSDPARTRDSRSRAQFDSLPRLFESPPERPPMVKVPRPGIA